MKVCSFFPRLVSDEDNVDLFEEINLEELSRGLLAFQKGKSPQSDGWMVEFFIAFFDLLGKDLLKVVVEVRVTSRVLPNFNSTFLALIPKKDKPEDFKD